ncbi:hypothetical protein HYALB_00004034 [Hymenoscyphus albidus]|uniref:Tetratricopeptide SHNi-TPR domain-containing protein n=1 Tax=Hymenoscyphus albidus TaxID=595503 RepID=A0A9N9QD69_9HELO|nr:hypothetical protein HYALB_00004034 [Hymenoscyphus albidus]
MADNPETVANPIDMEPAVAQSEDASSATEAFNSAKVSLADLCAKATAQYAHKNYEEASDLFSQASELQAELNGEMSPENAEILFLYGRSVFKVGQSKSDVLGGRASGEKKKDKKPAAKPKTEKPKEEEKTKSELVAEEGVAVIADQASGAKDEIEKKKPLFQFTGDENFEGSDDEDAEGDDAEGDEEEEEDDLAAAFQILDLARVLFTKKLEAPEDGEGKGKEVGDSSMTKHVKERLADTHDLLAEISLENERFPAAVSDFRVSLVYKKELYPEESEVMAEGHYKLALALEFASSTTEKPEGEDGKSTENDTEVEDGQALREEAIKEMQAAIDITNAKLQAKEVELASCSSPDDNVITRAQIADVKEMVAQLEVKLSELKAPAVDVDGIKETLGMGGGNAMGGVLGAAIGESPAQAATRIEEAKKTATDLTGLVRRKKGEKTAEATPEPVATTTNGTNGKRKAEEEVEESENKKAKVETAVEA